MSDLVNFKLAQRLKEKGFEWVKITTYNPKTKVRNNHLEPTISQVLKWLREEKKLFIEISCIYTDYFPTVRLLDSRQTDYIRGDVIYSTYEQAALAGIEYSLDNLI